MIILSNSPETHKEFLVAGTGSALLSFYGTSYSTQQDVLTSLEIYFDDQKVGVMENWSNAPGQHRMMCPIIVPVSLNNDIQDKHSITIKAGPNTHIDHNDRFTVTLDFNR